MPILIAIDISITNIFNTCALKGYVWFSLHHHPSEKLLPAILFSSHIEQEKKKQELFKGPVIIYRLGGGSEYLGGDHMVF